MKYIDPFEITFYDLRINIPHKIVPMKEAMEEYKNGKSVGTIQDTGLGSAKLILMNGQNNFKCDFDSLVESQWVVIL